MTEEQPPEPPHKDDPTQRGRDLVAVVLAAGIVLAMCTFTFAVLYDAIFSAGSGLSENATQVLSTSFAAIIGALAVYLGGRRGRGPE
jgi:hypothetical protein